MTIQRPDLPSPEPSSPEPTTQEQRPNRLERGPGAATGLSLTRLAIRRHISTLILGVAMVVLGWFSLNQLPVDLLPSITYPRIGLRLDAPGLVPEVGVSEVTRPLEEALAVTPGVTQIFSQTREGRISINLYFEPGNDIDQALNDATAALNRARNRLPDIVGEPRLFKFDPSQLPIYEMALTSPTLPSVALRQFSDEVLSRELTRVPGVANVDISGGVEEAIQVELDLDRMQASGIDIAAVNGALSDRNQDISGGLLRGEREENPTRLVGKFQSVDEIRNLIVSDPPAQIRLRDVATVVDGTEEQRVFVTLNGEPAVKVSLQKQPDANTVAAVDGVKAKLEQLRQSGLIPADMVMTPTLDESKFIRNSLRNVVIAGLSGAGLAAAVVLLFLGSLRQTLIVVVAIPLAVLTALVLMSLFGISLNVFSLGGLATGVGIVVDNAIVMLENIAAAREGDGNGDRPQRSWQRTVETKSQELESALLASTATNLASVIPFLLVGGLISMLFGELILTISFAMASSLAVALTIVPMLASRLLQRTTPAQASRRLAPGSQRLASPLQGFRRGLDRLTWRYAQLLHWLLRRRVLLLTVLVVVCLGSSYWMLDNIPREILPRIRTGQARLWAQFPPGTTASQNRKVMQAIDQQLINEPEVAFAFTTSGGAIFASTTVNNTLRGSSTITFQPDADAFTWIEKANQRLSQLPLIDTRVRLRPESVRGLSLRNSPVRAEIDIMLQGDDQALLEKTGQALVEALSDRAQLARYSPDADPPSPEIQIIPDYRRLANIDLSNPDIGETIETALAGTVPTQLQRGSRLVDVRVQLPTGSIQRIEQLERIPLFPDNQAPLRLGDVSRIRSAIAPAEIQRLNQQQIYLIEGSLKDEVNLSDALTEVDEILADWELPPGISRVPSSAGSANRQIQATLILLGSLAAFLVFVVMAVQYNSLLDPLVIMLTMPLALTGGLFGLWVTQTAIGATVIVGAVLLVGIVVNNAIVLVELANQIRERAGVSPTLAMLQAAPQRLRPILMTTLTTVLGLLPLALGVGEGSEFLQPLGIVVFSGLSFATLLTLFVIPSFYTLLHDTGKT